jgi:hypothetical protein
MTGIEHLELHVREELLCDWNVVPIEVFRMLALEEKRRSVPCRVSWGVGELADGWDGGGE